jgi:hypothetical protein
MTVTDKRAELASVLNSIEGVNGFEFRPSTPKVGSAWVLLESLDRGPGAAFSATWNIILCLGGDEKTAQDQLDALLPVVVDSIDQFGAYVDSARPTFIETSAGDLLGAVLRVRSE